MKRLFALTLIWSMFLVFSLSAFGEENIYARNASEQIAKVEQNDSSLTYKIKIQVNDQILFGTLYDNVTTRAFLEKLPITLPMLDLYEREMCYCFPDAMPTDDAKVCAYEVGEIIYYPPLHSFVFMYAQNGEEFEMQKLGVIDSGIDTFSRTGDVSVSIERWSEPTSIQSTAETPTTIKTIGNKIIINGEDKLELNIYDLSGGVIKQAKGYSPIEIDFHHHGFAIIEVRSGNHSVVREKVMVD